MARGVVGNELEHRLQAHDVFAARREGPPRGRASAPGEDHLATAEQSAKIPGMNGDQVTALLDEVAAHGLRVWVAGGWAVDAVTGRQTRPHGDLDLAIDAIQQLDVLDRLDRLGFVITVDWLPVRVELTAPDGRKVDVHPVMFRPDGSGVQEGLNGQSFAYAADGFAEGVIAGRRVSCLSVAQQLRFREGYPLRAVDHHDIALLRAAAGRG